MQTEAPDAEPPKRKRRWYQFSLRTLMVFVTLMAAASAYVAGQKKIVSDRKEMLFILSSKYQGIPLRSVPLVPPASKISWLRRMLGDEEWTLIVLPKTTSLEDRRTIEACYPEADLKWQSPTGRFELFSEDRE